MFEKYKRLNIEIYLTVVTVRNILKPFFSLQIKIYIYVMLIANIYSLTTFFKLCAIYYYSCLTDKETESSERLKYLSDPTT